MRLNEALGIDHLMIGTPDLAASCRQLERLGFTTSPRGVHEELGTANHVATFANGTYLELLGVMVPGPANDAYRAALESVGEGVTGIALGTEDAAAFHERARARGLVPGPRIDFSRWVDDAGKHARFSIVRLDKATLPPLSLFACQHWTPELVWTPDRLEHPNGVEGIIAVSLADPDGKACEVFSRIFYRSPLRDGDVARITLEPVTIGFRRAALSDSDQVRVETIVLSVSDIDRTRSWLASGSVPFDSSEKSLSVEPEHALGTRLEFRQG